MSLKPSEINVDQTVQLASDQYEIAFNGAEAFVDRGALVPATIETGFLDDNLQQNFLTNMSNGVIDEVELHVAPDDQTSAVRGRDAAAYAIESAVYVTYALPQFAASEDEGWKLDSRSPLAAVAAQPFVPGFPKLPVIPGVTVPEVVTGKRTAAEIAADLCSRVGLSLSYGAPNYVMREAFTVNGSVISAIQQLIAPFNNFEPSKYDIWTEGSLVIVRSRETAGPGIALDAHDTRITDLQLRARALGYIRVLRLLGSVTGAHMEGPGLAVIGFEDTETVDEMTEDGRVVSVIVTKEHIRQIDNAVLSQTVETWEIKDDLLQLVTSDSVRSDWDGATIVFPNQLVNSPRENERVITRSGFDSDDNFSLLSETRVSHSYDEDGYLKAQHTTKSEWDPEINGFTAVERESKTYRRSSSGSYQVTTTQYDADGGAGSTRRTTANGTPPGGPGRGVGSSGGSGSANEEPVVYAAVISSALGAKDVTISNPNLLLPELNTIAGQATRASGATEVEVSFTAAGMPWIHRGQTLTLTGLDDDLGYEIPLQPFLVTEAKLEYRESVDNPTYLTHVRGVFYDNSL